MHQHLFCLFASGALVTSQVAPLWAATNSPTQDNVRYVGAVTCKSSMCHGGASPSRDQFTIWSHADFHSRAYATLVTARSAQIAQGAGIESASTNARCTVCHAPADRIFAGNAAATVDISEGVSCEACHNGAASWLRSHTRPDYSYADRVHSGMKDMRSAFVRANTCVACHQVIDPALIKAGHPELTFELDGQSASEPRHWTEKADWFGPKAWIVGQAVALREITQIASIRGTDNKELVAQQNALAWLLQNVPGVGYSATGQAGTGELAPWSNQVAQTISGQDWNAGKTKAALAALTGTSSTFSDDKTPLAERQLRAERLVLGLDRLFKALHGDKPAPGQTELAALFDAVQDRAQFDPKKFAQLLQKFAAAIK